MKYRKLEKEQIIISLDRLTRFKPTKEKYLRVFCDIILSNLIEPSIKKSELLSMNVNKIRDIAQEIFNASIIRSKTDFKINEKLKEYENSVFYNDYETQELLNNNIDFYNALDYIDDDSVINLKWLKNLAITQNNVKDRENLLLKFPIEKVILVEGLTEEILLPAFSRFLGVDFYKKGYQIIPAGGKNQVVKMYYKLIEEIKIPIFILLDKDAEDNINQIKPKLRDIDKIHLVSCGEFEDLLPKSLIVKTVNSELSNFASIMESDLTDEIPKAKNLELIFKEKGLHEFKKADFAKLVRENISEQSDVSDEIKEIIKEILIN